MRVIGFVDCPYFTFGRGCHAMGIVKPDGPVWKSTLCGTLCVALASWLVQTMVLLIPT